MPRRSPRRPADLPPDDDATRRADPAAEPPDAAPADAEGRAPASDDLERTASPDDAAPLAAYALGALSPDERAAVEERLDASPALREELRRLIPVAALLSEATEAPGRTIVPVAEPPAAPPVRPAGNPGAGPLLELEPPSPIPASPSSVPSGGVETTPSPERGDGPPVRSAPHPLPRDDRPAASEEAVVPTLEGRPLPVRVEAAPGSLSSRPAGRRRATAVASARPARAPRTVRTWPLSWVAAGLATLVAVGAILWALALVDRLDARRREADALGTEVSRLRARGDAEVVTLAPVEGGPEAADGVVVVVPSEGSLVVRVGGLEASAEGRAYQVWFQDAPDDPWLVGPVFRVGERGTRLVELPVAAPPFTRVAVSEEPEPGSEEPSGAFLLEGAVAGADPGG